MTTQMSPSQAVVASLKAQGVDTVFGLDGDHVIYLFDALADAPEIRPITVKHENNAAIAAEVYGRLTGRPGVCHHDGGAGGDALPLRCRGGVRGGRTARPHLRRRAGRTPSKRRSTAWIASISCSTPSRR